MASHDDQLKATQDALEASVTRLAATQEELDAARQVMRVAAAQVRTKARLVFTGFCVTPNQHLVTIEARPMYHVCSACFPS